MLWFALLNSCFAAQLVSFDRILAQPLEQRVQHLRALDPRRRAAFARVAFDASETLPSRWRAITTMGRLDHDLYGPVIARALRSPEWFLRNAALIATLNDARGPAIDVATRALDDPALVVRTQAVRNLIHLDARAAEPRLWRALRDPRNFSARGESLWIRAHVTEALAKFAGRGRTREFQRLLGDDDSRVHRWAVRGLENATGQRLNAPDAPVEGARRRWLARLGDDRI